MRSSLALKGRRFETWDEVVAAVEAATAYWNAHKHSFVWGRRRRHQSSRRSSSFSLEGESVTHLANAPRRFKSTDSTLDNGNFAG